MNTTFVTGAEGFAGAHLVAELLRAGHRVLRSVRPGREDRPCLWVEDVTSADRLRSVPLELPDRGTVAELLNEERPAAVVHLAGVSFVPDARADVGRALSSNVDSVRALLTALVEVDPQARTRLVLPSTSHCYLVRGTDEPIDETWPLGPTSVYARTKLAAELVARCLAPEETRRLVVFRCFNHAGPGQDERFAIADFARQFARIEAGLEKPVVRVGDLTVRRDFTDVRDVVRVYRLAAEGALPPGTYNIASGRAVAVGQVLEILRELSTARVDIQEDPRRLRPDDIPVIVGSAAKLRAACGWEPAFDLRRTIRDTLEWWRRRVSE